MSEGNILKPKGEISAEVIILREVIADIEKICETVFSIYGTVLSEQAPQTVAECKPEKDAGPLTPLCSELKTLRNRLLSIKQLMGEFVARCQL